MSIESHLANARKLTASKRYEEAIVEYEYVLEIDPVNSEALGGLDKLRGATPLIQGSLDSDSQLKPKIATNFLAQQAKETHKPITKQVPVMIILVILGMGICYGLYQGVMFMINFEKIQAMKNVVVHLQSPIQKDGFAYVDVQIDNFNPQPITDTTFSYLISREGTTLLSGKSTVSNMVPAGDTRTFSGVKLGSLQDQAGRMHAELVDLNLGPKPRLAPELCAEFVQASSVKRKDALSAFKSLVKSAPEFAPAYVGLGQALAANSEMELAVRSYEKAIKLDPVNANAHYNLGVALYYQKKEKEALKQFEEASRLSPGDPAVAIGLKELQGERH